MTITLYIKELQEKWMRFYMNIMLLRSNDPKATALLEAMQQASVEFNEKAMKFFGEMETKA